MSKKIVLEFPEEVYSSLLANGYHEQRLSQEAKKYLAAGLFRLKVLSLGKAAELAQMSLWDFIPFLGSLEIPVIDYDADELGHELDSSDWISEHLKKKT